MPLAKLVASRGAGDLQSCLVSAAAVRRGVFAHPPEDKDNPLSRAEYGYLADPADLANYYRARCGARVSHHSALAWEALRDGDRVESVRLSDGTDLSADLWVDATGPEAGLIGPAKPLGLAKSVQFSRSDRGSLGLPATLVESDSAGWRITTQLRGSATQLSVWTGGAGHTFVETERETAWRGNVVAVGQAAAALLPLTVAPMRGLQRDVTRLGELLPVSTDMQVEARAFNAAARADAEHARLFHLALFADIALPDGDYWQGMAERMAPDALPAKLARKLTQYNARAHLVSYDHEPFDAGDWAILHDGVGRRPKRADRLASVAAASDVSARLDALRRGATSVTRKMPTHTSYMTKLLDYLNRRSGTHG